MRGLKRLHLFGDSYTYGTGCHPGDEYYDYWKKPGDAIWGDILAHKLTATYDNHGIEGASNDTIFDCVIDKWDSIKKDDYVIIGKSFTARFDLPNNLDETSDHLSSVNTAEMTVIMEGLGKSPKEWTDDDRHPFFENYSSRKKHMVKTAINWHNYFSWNRLYEGRYNIRFDFLEKLLKDKGVKVIVWGIETDFSDIENIGMATKNKIGDGHWSFDGNRTVAQALYERIIGPRPQTAI